MTSINKDHKPEKTLPFKEDVLTTREVAAFFRLTETTVEVEAFLRLTETTICKLAASGELPGIKIGKSWRFFMNEVLRRIMAATSHARETG